MGAGFEGLVAGGFASGSGEGSSPVDDVVGVADEPGEEGGGDLIPDVAVCVGTGGEGDDLARQSPRGAGCGGDCSAEAGTG